MKTDYNKIGGCVVNLDTADEYTTALNRRRRQIAISNVINEHEDMKAEITKLKSEITELKLFLNKLINIDK